MGKVKPLTDEEAGENILWLMYDAQSTLRQTIVDNGDTVTVDVRTVEQLYKIARKSRELAKHFREKIHELDKAEHPEAYPSPE